MSWDYWAGMFLGIGATLVGLNSETFNGYVITGICVWSMGVAMTIVRP